MALSTPFASGAAPAQPAPVKDIACGKGDHPEKTQGRAPLADVATGRMAKGYTCNAVQISHYGKTGGFRVERYVDKVGHECAYMDMTILFPHNIPDQATTGGPGTYVMDMRDPAHPVHTDTLRTGAFQSPHESVRLNAKRGLLVAALANPFTAPGIVDVYDVAKDCRHPELLSSLPTGVLGHESGFSPDGRTLYVASLYAHTLAAVNLDNPRVPVIAWFTYTYQAHGVSISDDGNTLYMAEAAYDDDHGDFSGLTVLDVTQVNKRITNPTVPIVSRLTWPTVSTPQSTAPFTRKGHRYVLETDEFGDGDKIGAVRIIDVQNVRKPFVVSNIRLAVNQGKAQGADLEADPGNAADQLFQGYQAHYCTLPSRVDPYLIACTFLMSGLRVFDIANPAKPFEIAYFNKPVLPGSVPNQPRRAGSFAMAAPAYDEKTGDIWYTDGNSGFYVVRLTGGARRAHFAARIVSPGN